VIKITFNELIQQGSAYSLITVKNSAGAVKMMTSSISGSVLTLTPVYNYLTGYKYTLNLPVNSVKDLAGNNLLSAYTSSFTVTPLTVNSTDPANNTVNVTTNKVIKITFNELIQQGSAYSQITVKNSGGVVKLMNASVSGSVLTLTPVYNYLTGDRYTVNLPVNSVKDSAGNGLATAYNSTFNTK
jgi:methionine-rich copper-binding protein CopC